MSDLLAGKTIVITGASSGIGRAIALTAAKHGAKAVIVSDITETPREGGEPTTKAIAALGLGTLTKFQHADVSSPDDNDKLIAAAEEFGGVDIMMCNAGISLSADGADVSAADFQRLMAINVNGTLFGAQAAARQMKKRGKKGSIILMASMGGLAGAAVTLAYSTSKGGIVQMARSLADAYGPDGIRVNAVAPGSIDTELLRATPGVASVTEGFRLRTPLRRVGQPDEIANVVVFLGSDLASYITGVILPVDGGLLAVI